MGKAYKMSSAQKRIFVLDQLQENSTVYNIPMIMEIKGQLNKERLEYAFNELINRHEVLRTRFLNVKEKFVQVIEEEAYIKLEETVVVPYADLSVLFDQFVRCFDLSQAPLLRVKLLKVDATTHVLFLDVHHIICDGGSIGVLFRDLSNLYQGVELPPLKMQYKNFSAWQNQRNMSKERAYWLDQFSNGVPVLDLKTDYKLPKERSFKGRNQIALLDSSNYSSIKQLSKQSGATDFMILLAAFIFFLSKYSRQEDIVVGIPVAGRTHPDTQDMLGMFVNTLAIRGEVKNTDTFTQLVLQIKDKCFSGYAHQDYPFEELVAELDVDRDPSRNPIFDVMFALSNQEAGEIQLGDTIVRPLSYDYKLAKFSLTVNLQEVAGNYQLYWEYGEELFDDETIVLMHEQFKYLLGQLLIQPEQPLQKINLLSEIEQSKIESLNQTVTPYEKEKSVYELFLEQVQQNPTKLALVSDEGSYTYQELNEVVERVATNLMRLGLQANQFVGLIAERNIDAVIGMLGIIRVGAAYVPIDNKYPESRIATIVEDCQCHVLITPRDEWQMAGSFTSVKQVSISQLKSTEIISDVSFVMNEPTDIAYMIYTSGTTGKPKGVMVQHYNINRLVKGNQYVDFSNMQVLQTGSLAFDASTFEIWGTLLNGGTLYIVDEGCLLNSYALKEMIDQYGISTMWLTASLFNHFVTELPEFADGLHYLIVGGEALSVPHLKLLKARNQHTKIINGYGPTETTTFALTYEIPDVVPDTIPIGTPIGNTTAYVMQEGGLCPTGVPGELYIGGAGVSKGYWKRPDLTDEKFVTNPFCPAERLYRTGDLCSLNRDGQIEYIGRIDKQVKVRGYRIELSEIENHLLQLPDVSAAAVILKELNGEQRICSYLVATGQANISELKEKLREVLPEYMIPSSMMFMDRLPVTINGKLDYQKLPDPIPETDRVIQKPVDAVEEMLLAIFEEVLGVDNIGTEDSFIDLGGDSIKGIKMVSKIREQGYTVTVREILAHRTIKKIKSVLQLAGETRYSQAEVTGKVPLTPIQSMFFKANMKKEHHFNQSVLLESSIPIQRSKLIQTFDALIKHHDVLRSRFVAGEQEILPVNTGTFYELVEMDLCQITDEKQILQLLDEQSDILQKRMDLANGPLFMIGLFHGIERSYLLLSLHHLIVDAVSLRILVEDLQKAYHAAIHDVTIVLPKKTLSFKDWSYYLQEISKQPQLIEEISYWNKIEQKVINTKLPVKQTGEKASEEVLTFDPEWTKKLIYQTRGAYQSEVQDLLLIALFKSLYEVTGNPEVSVNLEGHGREPLDTNIMLDRTMGWFTSMFPVAFTWQINNTFTNIRHCIEMLRNIPHAGIGYGVLQSIAHEELSGELSDITFNYLGEMQHVEFGESQFILSDKAHGRDIALENSFGSMLGVSAVVMDHQLQVLFHPDINQLSDEGFITYLAERYEINLKQLIQHCVTKQQEANAVDSIEGVIQKQFGVHSISYQVHVEEREYHVLFVAELDEALKQDLRLELKTKCSIVTYPDFIVPMDCFEKVAMYMSEVDFYHLIGLTERRLEFSLEEETVQQSIVSTYLPTSMQTYYLRVLQQNIEESIEITGLYTEEQLREALEAIVVQQGALRSRYHQDVIVEFTQLEKPFIPYIDLCYATNEYRKQVNQWFTTLHEKVGVLSQHGKLGQLIVYRISEKTHRIVFIGNHSIWDKTSTAILKELLLEQLEGEKTINQSLPALEDYAKEVNQSGNLSALPESEQMLLAEKISLMKQSLEMPKAEISHSEIIMIQMGEKVKQLYYQSPWKIITHLLKVIVKQHIQEEWSTYPIFMLQEDRRYMGAEYTKTLGGCLDLLPLSVSFDKQVGIEEQVRHMQQLKQKHQVHYLEMIVASGIPVSELIGKIFTLNYQGAFELNEQTFQRLLHLKAQPASTEIYVNHYQDYLVVSAPVPKGKPNLKDVLQEACITLEERLQSLALV